MEGVIGDRPLPNQRPESTLEIVLKAAHRRLDLRKEGRAVRTQVVDDLTLQRRELCLTVSMRNMVCEIESDASVALAKRFHAHPYDLSSRAQCVEIRRPVIFDPRRQDLALEQRRRDRISLQRFDCFQQCFESPSLARHSLPGEQQPRE